MKPEVLPSNFNPEQPSVKEKFTPEKASSNVSPEITSSDTESYEKRLEHASAAAETAITTSLPAPISDNSSQLVLDSTSAIASPVVAKDDDLIEKEWVDRAKQIVADTRDDPHQREKAVNRLQIDYLKKRYGRDLRVADSD